MPRLRDVFISHSHHDRDAVAALAARLGEEFDVYVDLDDPALADSPSEALAARLLDAIEHCRVLLFVVSARAVRSRWMPWELGLAHGRVGRILIWPLTAAAMRALEKQEYLTLYDVVDAEDPLGTLRRVVDEARRDVVPAAMRDAARIAGAYAAEVARHVRPIELPGATAAAGGDLSTQFTSGASEATETPRRK